MNVNHALYTLSPNDSAAVRHELEAEARPAANPAAQPRSLWRDPALYITVSVAVLLVTLLDMAVRMQ